MFVNIFFGNMLFGSLQTRRYFFSKETNKIPKNIAVSLPNRYFNRY